MAAIRENKYKREIILGIKVFFLAILAETFLFNYRHWESRSNEEIRDYHLVTSEALSEQEDGTYIVGEGEKYIEFTDIGADLDTLFFDITLLDREKGYQEAVMIYQSVRDESHEEYYWIPDREIWHSQEKSKYLTYHLYGNCKSLKITPAVDIGTHIRIQYTLNPRIPMFFSWRRVWALWGFVMFVYLFRPSSKIYRIPLLEMKTGKSIAFVAFLLGNMAFFYLISGLNPFFQSESVPNQQEYQSLARAFSAGQLSLLEEPGQALKNMENPYDYTQRAYVLGEAGEYFLWDHAYYEGKYYVYFGVVPAVFFYLPYYQLTGNPLHNRQVILIGVFMLLTALMGLIGQIIKRWFPKTSLGVWFLLSEIMVCGCGLIYMCKRPDMYTVPIIIGLGFGFLGFLCFVCAEKEGSLSAPLIGLGSLCSALVAGCRPQLFLIIILPVIFLRKYIFSFKFLRSKEGIRNIIAFAVPMVLTAALLMWYNYARFGSVFDFGANYNLCFNDMRRRGFVWDRIPLGIWAYLFAPVKTILTYPFVEAVFFSGNYLGETISEATYGGLFAGNLFAWLCPVLILLRKYIKKNTVSLMAFGSMLIGLVIIVADTEMSGILMRYFSDFSIFFLFAAFLSWLLLFDCTKEGAVRNSMLIFLLICFIFVAVYQGSIFFIDTGEALKDLRKELYSQIKYQVMFWL